MFSTVNITVTLLNTVTTNTTTKCNGSSDVCCTSVDIDVSFPTQTNALAVAFPIQHLLEYNEHQAQTYIVEGFDLVNQSNEGSIFQLSGDFINLNLRLLRFVFNRINNTDTFISSPDDCDITTTSGTLVSRKHTIPIAIGSTIGAVTIVAMAILIAIVAFIVKWHQKWSHKVNMDQFTINSTAQEFSNAVYDYDGKYILKPLFIWMLVKNIHLHTK